MKMPIWVLFLLLLSSVGFGNCKISSDERTALLKLPHKEFDQTYGSGWRRYFNPDCNLELASLLEEYESLHHDQLENWQRRILFWHSGQMYAFGGDYKMARIRFVVSIDSEQPADRPILWNDYVAASIAFLDKDLETLKKHRDNIANGPTYEGRKANLDIVDNLIKFFHQPYSVAYSR